jgi:alpha-galactosidase
MAIFENKQDKTFTLYTKNTMYQMKVDDFGVVQHIYYGKKMEYVDLSYSAWLGVVSFSPNPIDRVNYSNNHAPLELSVCGLGEFRINALALRNNDGSLAADPRFYSAEVIKGKYSIPGLPAFY